MIEGDGNLAGDLSRFEARMNLRSGGQNWSGMFRFRWLCWAELDTKMATLLVLHTM